MRGACTSSRTALTPHRARNPRDTLQTTKSTFWISPGVFFESLTSDPAVPRSRPQRGWETVPESRATTRAEGPDMTVYHHEERRERSDLCRVSITSPVTSPITPNRHPRLLSQPALRELLLVSPFRNRNRKRAPRPVLEPPPLRERLDHLRRGDGRPEPGDAPSAAERQVVG